MSVTGVQVIFFFHFFWRFCRLTYHNKGMRPGKEILAPSELGINKRLFGLADSQPRCVRRCAVNEKLHPK